MSHQTTTFVDPDKEFNEKRSQARSIKISKNVQPKRNTESELDLKKTRYEIMKFASNSLKNQERVSAEEKLVIELGGRKEKNVGVNYKVLMKERRDQKAANLEKMQSLNKPVLKPKSKTGKAKSKKKSKRIAKI